MSLVALTFKFITCLSALNNMVLFLCTTKSRLFECCDNECLMNEY